MTLRIPPEITSQIFSLIPPSIISEREPDPTTAPLLFMQVCREWRALALSMPVLWNSISVVFDAQIPESESGHQALCKVVDQWLSRSGEYPPHISYLIHGRWPTPGIVSTTLTRYAHRVETLDLQHDPEALAELLNSLAISLPILRKFSARGLRWISPAPHVSFSMLQHSPSLRDLALHIPLEYPFPGPIHWQTLTRFSGQGIYLGLAYAILQLAANLEELELSAASGSFYAAITPVTLPHLHKLTLTSTTDAVVLEWLTLPRLDALHVFVPSVNTAWFNHSPYLPAFLAFLARSGCPLTHLSLSGSSSDEEPGPLDLGGYLAPLAAHIVALRYDFLQPAESPFLGALLDRLESVSLMETALEEIYVRFPGHDMDGFLGLPAEVYERLNGLKKGGMSITVAKYEYWSEEKGREPDQILFD